MLVPSPVKIYEALEEYGPNGGRRQEMKELLIAAADSKMVVTIDYVSGNPKRPLSSKRDISVKTVHPHSVQAYCHLREDERFFSIKRIQHVQVNPNMS